MTNLPDLEQRVSGVNAQLGKAYVTGAKEAKSLSLARGRKPKRGGWSQWPENQGNRLGAGLSLSMGVESMTRHML